MGLSWSHTNLRPGYSAFWSCPDHHNGKETVPQNKKPGAVCGFTTMLRRGQLIMLEYKTLRVPADMAPGWPIAFGGNI